MVCSMRPKSQSEVQAFAEVTKRNTPSWIQDLAFAALSATHGLCLFSTWYWIAERAHLTVSENVQNTIDWINVICVLVTGVYMAQHIAFMLAGVTPPIPRYPSVIFLLWTGYFGIPALLTEPEKRPSGVGRVQFALSLLLSVTFVSYALTWAIWSLVKKWAGDEVVQDVVTASHMVNETALSESAEHVARDEFDGTSGLQMGRPNFSGETLVGDSMGDIPLESRAEPSTAPLPDQTEISSQILQNTPTPGSDSSVSDPEKKDDLSWPGRIFVFIVCVLVFPLMAMALYSGLWISEAKENQEHIDRQGVVEEARPPSLRMKDKVEDFWRSLTLQRSKTMVLAGIQWPVRLLLRVVLLLTWRLILAFLSLFAYTMNFYQRKVQENSIDVLAIALGLVNFVTLGIVYLCLFDGTGTTSPGWNSILG